MKARTILLPLVFFAASIGQGQHHVLGIAFNGDLYKVQLPAGTGTLVTNTGIVSPNCLAKIGQFWYTVDNVARFWRISETGSKTLIYTLSLGGATDVRAMAFDANLKTYVVVNGTASDELWSVNPLNGVGTLVGPMGSTTIQGLAVARNGKLYAYDVATTNAGGLKEVNPNTGVATDLDPASPGSSTIQDICPSSDLLLGGRDSLFLINPGTGGSTLLGSGGYADVRGWARSQTIGQLNSATVKLGQLVAGNAASLMHRDGNIHHVNKFFVPNQQVDPINVEVSFSSPLDHVNAFVTQLMWVGRMTTSGSFTVTLEGFNRVTNQWVGLGTGSVGTNIREQQGEHVGNVSAFFDANNTGLFRYRVKANGPTGSSSWGVEVDTFRLEEVDNF